eukprot:759361-Hanusia_phi.AAC.2
MDRDARVREARGGQGGGGGKEIGEARFPSPPPLPELMFVARMLRSSETNLHALADVLSLNYRSRREREEPHTEHGSRI